MHDVFIIAEAGDNHDGNLDQAFKLVDIAAAAGADAVKFQTFRSEEIISAHAAMALYQIENTGREESQLEMARQLELPETAWAKIAARCRALDVEFMSTPYDPQSLDLLIDLGLRRIKLPSGEITNAPLLLAAGRCNLPVILSTGMATMDEIREALGILAFGMTTPEEQEPSRAAFREAGLSLEGQAALAKNVTLLHCTTNYPAPLDEVNLRAMDTMGSTFGLSVGYSDHTAGLIVPVAAAARGASVIEKHFTLDRNLPGPDHKASIEPQDLDKMVRQIREVERCLGKAEKTPTPSESANTPLVRRGLVALRPLKAGELLKAEDFGPKRPEAGASPMDYFDLLGSKVDRDYDTDEPLFTSEPSID